MHDPRTGRYHLRNNCSYIDLLAYITWWQGMYARDFHGRTHICLSFAFYYLYFEFIVLQIVKKGARAIMYI